MGRKRRSIDSFLTEWIDLEIVDENLVCKYCKIKLPMQQNRVVEHVNSKKHISTKLFHENSQPVLNLLFRDKNNIDIEIDLVSIVVYDGLPLSSIDKKSTLRKFLAKYCVPSRSLPNSRALVEKQLPFIFQQNNECVKLLLKNKRFSLIIDESPDFRNRPLLNILACFYDHETSTRRVLMLDSKILLKCNAILIANEVSETLNNYEIMWKQCMAIVSDSAPYMKKYCRSISTMYHNIIRIPCFSHLIHLSVKKSINTVFHDVKHFCMKFSALLSKNRSPKNSFLHYLDKQKIEFS